MIVTFLWMQENEREQNKTTALQLDFSGSNWLPNAFSHDFSFLLPYRVSDFLAYTWLYSGKEFHTRNPAPTFYPKTVSQDTQHPFVTQANILKSFR